MKNKDAIVFELLSRSKAAKDFLLFIKYTKPDFEINWHHRLLAEKLQSFSEGHIKKLMIFLPPQVGKSEMSTRRLPSFILGKDPDKRLAVCAYNQTFSSQFNRDIQRIMTDTYYRNIFPGTRLNEKNVVSNAQGSFVRNSEVFEIVGRKGRLKTVGVGGALTGTSVDIGIIDDPIKDAMEAYSSTFRDRLWDWYDSVFCTRLHNESQQLITLTRWHEDDLAGRIMKRESDWEIVILPAIKEDYTNDLDIREIGEAIWPQRHSLERMLSIKKNNPLIFSSLYQQRPYFNAEEGRFAFAFERSKHVGHCFWNPRQNTYLSFDFNRNPICCTIFQWYDDTIYIPRCIKLKNSNIYSLCELVLKLFPNALFIVTGDASGNSGSAMVKDNINYYVIIKKLLNLNDGQLQVNSVNPRIESNQVLVNALLQNYKWIIDEENASAVIFDMEYVKMLPNGTIDKGSRSDPTKQADAMDTVRYWCDRFMKWFLKVHEELPTMDITPAEVIQAKMEVQPLTLKPNTGFYGVDVMDDAIKSIERGELVICTKYDYSSCVRDSILNQAGKWIDSGDGVRAQIALLEVKRLDEEFRE